MSRQCEVEFVHGMARHSWNVGTAQGERGIIKATSPMHRARARHRQASPVPRDVLRGGTVKTIYSRLDPHANVAVEFGESRGLSRPCPRHGQTRPPACFR